MSNNCKICPNLVISTAVTFAADTLVINIPAGSYSNGQKVCLVLAQTIPEAATIEAPAVITIGAGTVQYPLLGRNGLPVFASQLRTRTKYATCVATNTTSGVFRLQNHLCDSFRGSRLPAINGTDTPADGTG